MTEQTKIEIPEFITIRELANLIDTSPITIIKELMTSGIMANINQQIDFDTVAIILEELGFDAVPYIDITEVEQDDAEQPEWRRILAEEKEETLEPRPPVITMLGHVDHGKTSLLDVFRSANVQVGEAGGITQHIGAYQITYENETITFLDTPGHEAFTAMRARGAQATDIAILVVAADDGIMPQTKEAADHARAAKVPIIVAMNKMDLETANPNKVKQQLSEIGLVPDEWNGDTLVIPVSAKTKEGIEDLLEAILLTSESINPQANYKASPTGTVLEAKIEKGLGVMANLLIQNGTLKLGDILLIGEHYGRIRIMYDHHGNKLKKAKPSTPVSVSGLNGLPSAGDQFCIVKTEKIARKLATEYEQNQNTNELSTQSVSLEDFFAQLEEGESKTLNLIIKADVQGSLEPLVASLNKLSNEQVNLEILRASTGGISENDIMLASASEAVVLGFNVGIDAAARLAASNERVDVRTYAVIYKLLEDVEHALKGMMEPVYEESIIGRSEVREIFRIRGVGQIAGCYMRTGVAKRNANVRLIRNREIIYAGSVASLKHHQDNVNEVKTGFEFGIALQGWNDVQSGDLIEFFITQRKQV